MVNIGEFLKTWSLRSNSVTRQVNFNKIKIGENAKIEYFKCDILSVKKSQKRLIQHCERSELRPTFTFWSRQKSLKTSKIVNLVSFLKPWSLLSKSVTRQVKIDGKCKNSKATFWVNFKLCDLGWEVALISNVPCDTRILGCQYNFPRVFLNILD